MALPPGFDKEAALDFAERAEEVHNQVTFILFTKLSLERLKTFLKEK